MTWFFVPQDELSENKQHTKHGIKVSQILSLSGIGIWNCDMERHSLTFVSGFFERYGYAQEEIDKLDLDTWITLIFDDDKKHVQHHLIAFFAGESCGNIDYTCRIVSKIDQSLVWIHVHGVAFEVDTDGTPIRAGGTIQDVTKIKHAEESLKIRDRLTTATNEVARILLDNNEDFDLQIWHTLEILGSATKVDRVYIWRNHTDDIGRLYSTQIYEWSINVKPQQGTTYTTAIPFDVGMPTWETTLTAGKCVNNLVRLMPKAEQDQLTPQGIISILVAPIMFGGDFWGFIGFDDCTRERTWSETEVAILKSAGMLVAAAIIRRKTQESLDKEQALMRRIFETSPTGVVITSRGILMLQNAPFANMHGLKIGENIEQLYVKPTERNDIIKQIKTKGSIINREIQFHCADGVIREFLTTYQSIQYDEKPSWLCWAVDVSELKKAEKSMKIARDLAEAGTKAKGEFLAKMSHEIRTPMNAILGMIYLCLQTDLTDKQRDYILKTQTATMNLLEIIDDILDFSKIEAGKIELENIKFHLSEVLRDIIDVVEIKAHEKGLKLNLQIDESVHDNLIGDPTRLRQILTNLVNNAVKFTDKGEVTIKIKPFHKKINQTKIDDNTTNINLNETDSPEDNLSDNLQDNLRNGKSCAIGTNDLFRAEELFGGAIVADGVVMLSFEVADTGIGMTDDQISHLFKSFSQADDSTTRKYGGTGLGLAISKNLVELMGGSIMVCSELGKGSEFRFVIPFMKVEQPPLQDIAVDLSNKRILVVDDDPVAREHIRELVVSLSMRVTAVDSGDAAIAALLNATKNNIHYDLTLLDWKMPRMDGIETIRRIRMSPEIKEQPQILMISAYDRNECLRQSRELGLAGFLVKPVTMKGLQEALQSAFNNKSTIPTPENILTPKGDNIHGKKILLVEDNKINQLVASEILKSLGVEIEIANNGIEAIESVQKNDFDLILMDVQMPIMDGLTATKEIRKLQKNSAARIPILAMTANAMDTDYQKSVEAGMDDHLTKPIDPEKLKQSLEIWIGKITTNK
ncbi:MAG: response regulator [Planctomycetaceae bacterium]|jgi:PAS domain S-box-containing protein|nr:response regulator [Planctomycetaceae bacterium]